MKLKKLKETFFLDNPDLKQALYDKNRGYGIVLISYKNLTFGIPLHSNIDPKKGFETIQYEETTFDEKTGKEIKFNKSKGLDYQKAVLLFDETLYIDRSFKIPSVEFDKIMDNKEKIKTDFENYVKLYVQLYQDGKFKQLSREYKFSTLVNYHPDLDIL